MAKPLVWLDFDPAGLVWTGLDVDDDLAYLLLVSLEEAKHIDLVGVSVTAGNAPLRHVSADFERLAALVGRRLSPRHGQAGAGWRDLRPGWPSMRRYNRVFPDVPSTLDDAADALIDAAANAPTRKLTVVSLGPCTTLARALRKAPWLAGHLERAVLMGGELTGGKLDLNFMASAPPAARRSPRAAHRVSLAAHPSPSTRR